MQSLVTSASPVVVPGSRATYTSVTRRTISPIASGSTKLGTSRKLGSKSDGLRILRTGLTRITRIRRDCATTLTSGCARENDPSSISYYPKKKRDENPRACRSTIRRPGWANSELVISDSKHHSARRLCMSDSSFGPGFAHTEEGLFCDMDAKVLYAFCADIVEKSACFDLKRQRIVAREEATGVNATSTINGSARYSRIRDWRTNSTVA